MRRVNVNRVSFQESGAAPRHTPQKSRSTRRLGAARGSVDTLDRDIVPRFPPLHIDTHYGVQGTAMSAPTQRDSPDDCQSGKLPPAHCDIPSRCELPLRCDMLMGCGSAETHQSEKAEQLRELRHSHEEALARGAALAAQMASLQSEMDGLSRQLADKQAEVDTLTARLGQEDRYRGLYEREAASHAYTQTDARRQSADLHTLTLRYAESERESVRVLANVHEQHARRVAELEAEKCREVALRDDKMARLKAQMADALQGNSWERQQQLDELTKDLAKSTEEADLLRVKLKAFQRNSASQDAKDAASCQNCAHLTAQVDQGAQTGSDKDRLIEELKAICSRFETQLRQQDELLRKFADNNNNNSFKVPSKFTQK